jgi:hypothetical protein
VLIVADFAYSSTRRVLTFNLSNSPIFLATFPEEVVSVDGVNRVSHSLQLLARRIPLSTFSTDAQEIIRTTEDSKGNVPNPDDPENDPEIMILEDGESLGVKVEQWAVEYTSKFVHAKGPKFHSTTMAQILGTAYIKKGLPEVSQSLRVTVAYADLKQVCSRSHDAPCSLYCLRAPQRGKMVEH